MVFGMFYTYIVTNTVNGKLYVGQTNNPDNRWRQHVNEATRGSIRSRFYNAMRKHGVDKFTFNISGEHATSEDADKAEIGLIDVFDADKARYGYNIAPGGRGEDGRAAANYGAAIRHVAKLFSIEEEQALFEKHSKAMRKQTDRLTPEQKRARMEPALQAQTTEMRSEFMKRRNAESGNTLIKHAHNAVAAMTPEERSDIRKAMWATKSAEERSAILRKSNAAQTSEERSDKLRRANAVRTPEQKAASHKKRLDTLGDEGRKKSGAKTWATRRANIILGLERDPAELMRERMKNKPIEIKRATALKASQTAKIAADNRRDWALLGV